MPESEKKDNQKKKWLLDTYCSLHYCVQNSSFLEPLFLQKSHLLSYQLGYLGWMKANKGDKLLRMFEKELFWYIWFRQVECLVWPQNFLQILKKRRPSKSEITGLKKVSEHFFDYTDTLRSKVYPLLFSTVTDHNTFRLVLKFIAALLWNNPGTFKRLNFSQNLVEFFLIDMAGRIFQRDSGTFTAIVTWKLVIHKSIDFEIQSKTFFLFFSNFLTLYWRISIRDAVIDKTVMNRLSLSLWGMQFIV